MVKGNIETQTHIFLLCIQVKVQTSEMKKPKKKNIVHLWNHVHVVLFARSKKWWRLLCTPILRPKLCHVHHIISC
jgi:hypothetical protein